MQYKGKVIQSTGRWYKVATDLEDFEIVDCRLPGRFRLKNFNRTNPLAVGDNVKISLNEEDGTGNIEEIKERYNYLTRDATHGKKGEQILAANIDCAIVVQSVRLPALKTGFTDRFLVTCEAYELPPLILINKRDLIYNEEERDKIEAIAEMYRDLGYQVLLSSIHDKDSMERLKHKIKDQTSVFVGPSGVGKSSVLNTLDPSLELKVGAISDATQKGTHATTHAQLVPLEFGGYIIDTPGIREFGLVDIEPAELSLFFPEMIDPGNRCQFNDCTHTHEPNCGVKEAYEKGEIYESRYKSYVQILDSLSSD